MRLKTVKPYLPSLKNLKKNSEVESRKLKVESQKSKIKNQKSKV